MPVTCVQTKNRVLEASQGSYLILLNNPRNINLATSINVFHQGPAQVGYQGGKHLSITEGSHSLHS